MPLLLGVDVGSSSVKACLLNADTGRPLASAASPDNEMEIKSPRPGWAEQSPELWWSNLKIAIARIKKKFNFDPSDIKAVGISYHMHGLVLTGRNGEVLRPAIIWCDSRAVDTGAIAEKKIGSAKCFRSLLNTPGNFTASKLKWVMDNEPEVFRRVKKFLLPGDFIAMKMTGDAKTTSSGLSEAVLWDFRKREPSSLVIDHFGFSRKIFPSLTPVFSDQGKLTGEAAKELGLAAGTAVSYRAGDQPNNAFTLGALNPGDAVAAAGTSGVVYAVTDKNLHDKKSRVNVFSHVNDSPENLRRGVLLCVNGAGILYSWIRRRIVKGASFNKMNCLAMEAPAGSGGLMMFPFGNGSERTLGNIEPGAMLYGLKFNSHDERHLIRAAQEGIVFALSYGIEIMKDMGMDLRSCRAGDANMFQSRLFSRTFADTTGMKLSIYNTDGAQGAARGAGMGAGIFKSFEEAFKGLEAERVEEPGGEFCELYSDAYRRWKQVLESCIIGRN